MKVFFFIFTVSILISACIHSTKSDNSNNLPTNELSKTELSAETKINQDTGSKALNKLFGLADAEKILGQAVNLIDSSTQYKGDVLMYQSGYKAKVEDAKSEKTGAVYFLVEKYNTISLAQNKYSFIKKANEDHAGIKTLKDLGDEAYFHSDGKNFYFIMVRKGAIVFNIKVNKITSKTSLDEFNFVAKRIVARF